MKKGFCLILSWPIFCCPLGRSASRKVLGKVPGHTEGKSTHI